jgi:hypothetical protein
MKSGKSVLVVLACLASAVAASAQEPERPAAEAEAEDSTPAAERPQIRVLRDPYDIASFYRSAGRPYFVYGLPPYTSYSSEGFHEQQRGRYPISSYYRQGGGGHYSAFWQSGYRARPLVRPGLYGPAFRETIGENGDLYLFAPFLAPMGAIAGAYYR